MDERVQYLLIIKKNNIQTGQIKLHVEQYHNRYIDKHGHLKTTSTSNKINKMVEFSLSINPLKKPIHNFLSFKISVK